MERLERKPERGEGEQGPPSKTKVPPCEIAFPGVFVSHLRRVSYSLRTTGRSLRSRPIRTIASILGEPETSRSSAASVLRARAGRKRDDCSSTRNVAAVLSAGGARKSYWNPAKSGRDRSDRDAMNRTASYGSFRSMASGTATQSVPETACAGAQPMLHAASARCPASPRSSHNNEAATVRSSSLKATGDVPYQRSRYSDVQARVLSRWHELHAFGLPTSTLSATVGLLIV